MKAGRLAAVAATMAGALVALTGLGSFARQPAPVLDGVCSRFDITKSTAFNTPNQPIAYPWRRDLPADPGADAHAWDAVRAQDDWQAYMDAVLSEIKASGLTISNAKASMNPDAKWWVAPWMDYTDNGREKLLGLTKERNAGAGDLSPDSPAGPQVWAVGFYNQEGAHALGKVFADPCNPQVPTSGWTMPGGAASFKLLFTTATGEDVEYLTGSPEVTAFAGSSFGSRQPTTVRLLQMDISVRDPRTPNGWVLGTYIWQGPAKGDGLFDNLVPVGLMWGNDQAAAADPRDAFATLQDTKLNPALAGVVWRGHGQTWDERPWPGFQGRLNGPADNLVSTCMSCHALAQWPRSKRLSILPMGPKYTMSTLNDAATRQALAADYLKNVPGGTLTDPTEAAPASNWGGARPLDYSLQVEAAFTRMCQACLDGRIKGPTPDICRVQGARTYVSSANCPNPNVFRALGERLTTDKPARQ